MSSSPSLLLRIRPRGTCKLVVGSRISTGRRGSMNVVVLVLWSMKKGCKYKQRQELRSIIQVFLSRKNPVYWHRAMWLSLSKFHLASLRFLNIWEYCSHRIFLKFDGSLTDGDHVSEIKIWGHWTHFNSCYLIRKSGLSVYTILWKVRKTRLLTDFIPWKQSHNLFQEMLCTT